jgi:hypothetical protein
LNLYGFNRLTRGLDSGAYYHELFLRGKPALSHGMFRIKIKGAGIKAANSPDHEPDFYALPPVVSNCDLAGAVDLNRVPSAQSLSCEQYQPRLEPTFSPSNKQDSHFANDWSLPQMTVSPGNDCEPDQATDVLWLELSSNDDREMLQEFCSDWDPTLTFDVDTDIDALMDFTMSDDWMLDLMVEQLLED